MSASFLVKVGSRHESARDNGLSHFLEHMFFRGTERLPSAYEVSLAIEDLGGSFSAATHTDFTTYELTIPYENAAHGLRLLGEIVTTPVFENIDVEKKILKEEILEDLDEDGRDIDVDNIARRSFFKAHPLGQPITGPLDNVMRFTRADLRRHMATHYNATNSVLSVSGRIADPEGLLDVAARAFSALPSGAVTPLVPPTSTGTGFAYVDDDGSQADLRLSYPGISLHDPRAMALTLLGRILDDGMSTRVYRAIVDQRGLAYDAFAGEDNYEDCGAFDFGATIAHESVVEVASELRKIAETVAGDVTERELDKARRRFLWDLRLMLDDDAELAEFYGVNTLFGLKDTLESSRREAERVTLDDIRAIASAIFTSELHIAVVGMLKERDKNALRSFAQS